MGLALVSAILIINRTFGSLIVPISSLKYCPCSQAYLFSLLVTMSFTHFRQRLSFLLNKSVLFTENNIYIRCIFLENGSSDQISSNKKNTVNLSWRMS